MSDKPESKAGELKPPKIKAEDNPWYLLTTLLRADRISFVSYSTEA